MGAYKPILDFEHSTIYTNPMAYLKNTNIGRDDYLDSDEDV
jgi:hypothetical protein